MHKILSVFLFSLIAFNVNAQTVNLRGKVSNSAGKPVANAIVSIVNQGLKDTTGTDGAYSISNGTPVVSPVALIPQFKNIVLKNGSLEFSLPDPAPLKVEIYSIEGRLLSRELILNASRGLYRFNIDKNFNTNLLVIRTSIGQDEFTFRYVPSTGKYLINQSDNSSLSFGSKLAKLSAINDTVKVTAKGFTIKTVPITSYDQQLDITLDSLKGNLPGPSAGCGKPLSSLKTGTYTITSAGLSRQYMIDIPANYDMNHPYRLIFGMHCYGSSMQGVAGDKFYQLKRFADSTKNYCIFVAPNGYGTGTPLWNQGEKDHAFFDDMLKLFKGELCIDTTRVFSCGFSYGAMFSYSLSTNHQKVLRAVACYAPANWNIWLPTNTHEPIAFMSTTGISDGNCSWIHSDANKEGGKYCVLGHAEDNGCTIPATIPMAAASSKSHLCYEFQGCKEGYPVKVYTFDGGHQCGPMDGVEGDNTSKSWIPGETWNFFMQF
jgi:poly(3-hydroxybutyrate) depolymerase